MKRILFLGLILILSTTLTLTGCGGSKPVETEKATDQTKTIPEQTGPNEKIKLTIYCEEDQPREFLNPQGELTGLSVELVQEIQKRVGNTDKIQLVPWARGYAAVQKEPNVVLFSMARNAERNALFQWVGPIDEISYAFYAKADSPLVINSLEDAKKVKSIGVITDEIRDIYLKSKGFTNLVQADDTAQNYKKLMSGRIDLMPISTDKAELDSEAKEFGFKSEDFKQLYVFMKIKLYIAMSKETPSEVVESWNDALDAMRKDGTFQQIMTKYFPGKALPGPAITNF